MRLPFQLVIGLVVVAVILAAIGAGRGAGDSSPATAVPRFAPASDREMPAAKRDAGFRFDPAMALQDRQVIEAAIAAARPEAQRLIAEVDGLTSLRVGALAGPAGTTTRAGDGYEVFLDLGAVSRGLGPRGVSRLVLHELGHVIDFAIVPAELQASLDAGIPVGWGCDGGHSGACAIREERFAESFAKWAMNDIGVDLYIGYRVPPPDPSLDVWGEPLAGLIRAG